MKYFEVEFTISPFSADAADLFASLAGEAGFETFEDTDTGLKGYVQQSLFDEDTLRACIEDFPFEGTSIIYNVREAEDRDWNEQWEQEGFEPIVIADQLVIHDGRHLPEVDSKIQIEIDAKLAFLCFQAGREIDAKKTVFRIVGNVGNAFRFVGLGSVVDIS